jgi:hypothetical protein
MMPLPPVSPVNSRRRNDLRRRRRRIFPQPVHFTQRDPIGLAGGLNLYGYAGGDPINRHDPFGLSDCDKDMPDEEREACEKAAKEAAAERERAIATCKADLKRFAITTAMWSTGLGALKYAGHARTLMAGGGAFESQAFAGFMLNSTMLGTTSLVRAANTRGGGTDYGFQGAGGFLYEAAKFVPTPVASMLELGEAINSCIAAAQSNP